MPEIVPLLRALQLGDSTLPVGAFSFSNGLESAIQAGIVHDAATLRGFVRTACRQAATADGIALLVAHRAAAAGDIDGVLAADRAVIERKLAEEMRTMSVRMGRKLAELALSLAPLPLVEDFLVRIKAGATPGTYPAAQALAFAGLGLPARDAFAAQQYGVASMMVGAALRLMRLSYIDGQRILFDVNGEAEAAFAEIAAATLDEMATFAPLADILAACHVKAHVRMFMN
ncbi:MAG: urease accessory protein UreF [Geminicoccaceae bacterium]